MKILLILYDNGSYVHYFPIGTAYIAATLIKHGYEVDIWNQDINHYPDSYLRSFLSRRKYDVVGLGFVGNYYTYRKAIGISRAINESSCRPHFILGGHGPSADPEFFKNKTGADAVVVGEGEHAVLEAIYKNGIFRAETIKDIDSIPWPAYKRFPIWYYRLRSLPHSEPTDFSMPVLSSRGCVYKCNFCYRYDEGIRLRSIESVIDEIKFLIKHYRISYIDFADELTTVTDKRTIELCEKLKPLRIKWMCNGRLNLVDGPVLRHMAEAGCKFINYGIESLDNDVLKGIGKKQTVDQIYQGIEGTLKAGISPGFNVILGHIGDTEETMRRGLEFILKYDDGAQRRTMLPVTPYPGSALFGEAIKRGLLKDTADFYKKHKNSDLLTVNFTDLTDDEFYKLILGFNAELLINHYNIQLKNALKQAKDLYMNRNTSFRGFR
jgi:anaerobic magnesium-protoporphyrin IX monomethyl ester cyclase